MYGDGMRNYQRAVAENKDPKQVGKQPKNEVIYYFIARLYYIKCFNYSIIIYIYQF